MIDAGKSVVFQISANCENCKIRKSLFNRNSNENELFEEGLRPPRDNIMCQY